MVQRSFAQRKTQARLIKLKNKSFHKKTAQQVAVFCCKRSDVNKRYDRKVLFSVVLKETTEWTQQQVLTAEQSLANTFFVPKYLQNTFT